MEQCKRLAMLYFILGIILISVEKTDTTCVLPSVLANSVWTYSYNVTTGQTMFGKSTMAGFGVIIRGNELKDFHCISNTTDVYVFKADDTYSDRGQNRQTYRCMKVTKVTENLVYLYFLSDLDSTVIPPSRFYSPLPDNVLADNQSTCSFCNYTQPPKAEEYFLLKRENTDEKLTMTPNPCLPCEADCTKDHCDPNPCQNGGSCTSGLDGYTCKCTAGWMNKNCSDHCDPNPCQNGGSCTSGLDGYTCKCTAGWMNKNCSDDIKTFQWEPWSACSATFGDGIQERAKFENTGILLDNEKQNCKLQNCKEAERSLPIIVGASVGSSAITVVVVIVVIVIYKRKQTNDTTDSRPPPQTQDIDQDEHYDYIDDKTRPSHYQELTEKEPPSVYSRLGPPTPMDRQYGQQTRIDSTYLQPTRNDSIYEQPINRTYVYLS